MTYRHEFERLKKALAKAYKGVNHIEAWPALLDMPGEFQSRVTEPIKTACQTAEDIRKGLIDRPTL